ncbi:3',5'-cyclic adenosine monophosphate phosphodiesterase CpdA [compost metagenome]
MSNVKWTKEIDLKRVELMEKGFSYKDIARVLVNEFGGDFTSKKVMNRSFVTSTTKSSVLKNTVDSVSKNINGKKIEKQSFDVKNDKILFPAEAYDVNESVSFTPEKKRRLKAIYDSFNDGKQKKILSISDLHAPFINFEAVEKALLAHGDADILVLNGDVFDGHALSDFDKLIDFDIEVEFEQVFLFLDVATKLFKKIIWNGGNHDFSRFIRTVSKKFGAGMKSYVLKRLNPIEYIAEKYDNITIVPNQFFQIGECVFTHPDGYSSALMSTALGQEKSIRANAENILPNPKFTCVVQGHTHDLGEYYINGCKVMEQGCMTHVMDYRFDKPASRRWVLGYAVIQVNNDGSIDFNNTRTYLAE